MPPNALFPMFCMFSFANSTQHATITALFLPVILTLPLAFFGARLEKHHREWQVAGYIRTIRRFRTGRDLEPVTRFSVWTALLQLFTLNFTAFFCVTSLVLLAVGLFENKMGTPLTFQHASWPLLWVFAAIGGVTALRIRRSYIVFVAGSAILGLLAL